jgi:hypothetical protein
MNDNTTNPTGVTNTFATLTTSALAATSKTPFRTAFLITVGIGLGHLVNFLLGITALTALVTLAVKILS